MDAFLYRWGWALAVLNLLGCGLALFGLYGYLYEPYWRDPGLMMGLGVVLMMPQTFRLLLRHWVADERVL
ncbi:hypothetical protein [Ferrimonas balearica]|uniref:hypothetical protein n=1 Tax=Ferrimonas balearica TaxID=44012 RepID=UPI001C994596|nr:hypothetical protein [Ferrimonas balearica]MBY5923262.1 hypothetical protein [Ferrimonas balearica]MBY5995220.1 hypothetical protein [Ferrimonas balearica]